MIRRWRFAPTLPLGVQVLVPSEDGEWVSHHDHEAEIARVREDERSDRATVEYGASRYAAALRDAVEAVPHDIGCWVMDEPRAVRDCDCWRRHAVAAIEALCQKDTETGTELTGER